MALDGLKSAGGRLVGFLLLLHSSRRSAYLFSSLFGFTSSFSSTLSRMGSLLPGKRVRTVRD